MAKGTAFHGTSSEPLIFNLFPLPHLCRVLSLRGGETDVDNPFIVEDSQFLVSSTVSNEESLY